MDRNSSVMTYFAHVLYGVRDVEKLHIHIHTNEHTRARTHTRVCTHAHTHTHTRTLICNVAICSQQSIECPVPPISKDAAVHAVAALCVDGARVADLCAAGDQCVEERLATLFKTDTSVEKGFAQPTSVSLNSVCFNCSPNADDETYE